MSDDRVSVPYPELEQALRIMLIVAPGHISEKAAKVMRRTATDIERERLASWLTGQLQISGWEVTRRRIKHPSGQGWLE